MMLQKKSLRYFLWNIKRCFTAHLQQCLGWRPFPRVFQNSHFHKGLEAWRPGKKESRYLIMNRPFCQTSRALDVWSRQIKRPPNGWTHHLDLSLSLGGWKLLLDISISALEHGLEALSAWSFCCCHSRSHAGPSVLMHLIGWRSNMGGWSSASSMAVMPRAQMSHRWL